MRSAFITKLMNLLQYGGGYITADGFLSTFSPDSTLNVAYQTGQVTNIHQLILEGLKIVGGVAITISTRYIERHVAEKRRVRRARKKAAKSE